MKVTGSILLALFVIVAGYWICSTQSHNEIAIYENVIEQTSKLSPVQDLSHQASSNVENTVQGENQKLLNDTATNLPEEKYSAELQWIEMVEDENLFAIDTMHHLQPMLSHSEPALRLAAVNAISGYKHSEINHTLTDALYDPNPVIRATVVESLSMQMDDSMIAYIEPALYDPNLQVRIAAIWAIAELESEQGVYALAALLSDQTVDIRLNAVAALGEMGRETSIHYLKNQRHDPDERIRRNVAAILDEIEADF
ncbi:MAG: HEAT repeat domain-containing protein [Candidatus Thiodiazotropha sp. (ex. Lucinisca nassula)]|uniref:HEAT repeat domain-containing protein n=1 Tax=Candidatus Thiodiazotropha sp. LNASS1 TaxID=3096260 RepID=UPI002813D014|nr:HEAT repeat domain-containing protein [Candidatus Thiodiazotropha sp. (ex. Lucinisca nassula)]